MSWLITFLLFVPVFCYAVVFWFRVGRWFYHHGQETRERVIRLRDAARSAWQEGEFSGDASHR